MVHYTSNICSLRYRHARKHLVTQDTDQLASVQRCMALLAFPTDTGASLSSNVNIRRGICEANIC